MDKADVLNKCTICNREVYERWWYGKVEPYFCTNKCLFDWIEEEEALRMDIITGGY